MLIETLSVFPEMFEPVMSTSILGRARKAGLFDFKAYNLRDWTHDRHRTVDDEPYGGGQGMLMKVEPIAEAIEPSAPRVPSPPWCSLPPAASPLRSMCRAPAQKRASAVCMQPLRGRRRTCICVCRRAPVDRRLCAHGRRTSRYGRCRCRRTPDSRRLGDEMSNVDESFSTAEDGGLLEYAQYTRPAEFNGEGVPPVLVSGDHAKVDAWRRKNAIERTCRWRPD